MTVKNEEDGLGPVTRPKRQKRRLGKLREKGSWYKRPAGSAMESGKPDPASLFTRKSAARAAKAVDGYNCLSTTKAAQAKDSWEYETVLFFPVTTNER